MNKTSLFFFAFVSLFVFNSCKDEVELYDWEAELLQESQAATRAGMDIYPATGDESASATFKVTINGEAANVEQKSNYDAPIHFVQLAADDNTTLTVSVTASEAINSAEVLPSRKGIVGSVDGDRLNFSVKGSHYLCVKINNLPDLFIFIDPLKDYTSQLNGKRVFRASDYVKSGTSSPQTESMQTALNDAAACNAVLYFPKGKYKTGTVEIPSNTTIYLEKGAEIVGSTKESDYRREKEYGTNAAAVGSLFRIKNAENVHIFGNGTIDGAAWSGLRRAKGSDTNLATEIYLIYATDCRNIHFDGITLRDADFWNSRIFRCTDVEMKNVKVLNCRPVSTYNTTDGIDFDSSQRCTFKHGFIYGGDDNCVVKGRDRKKEFDTFDILFEDVVCYSNTCATKIGTESFNNKIHDVTFRQIDIISAQRSMGIDVKDGSQISDVHFEDIRIDGFHKKNGSYRLIDLSLNNRDKVECLSNIEGVTFNNIRVVCPIDEAKVRIKGLSNESRIDNVLLSNVWIQDTKVSSFRDCLAQPDYYETNEFATNIKIDGQTVLQPEETTMIMVDDNIRYQFVEGFGGMNTKWQSSTLSTDELKLLFGSADDQLALNILRLRISPNGESDWKQIAGTAKTAKSLGATLLACPWTPPVKAKSNGNVKGGKCSDYRAYADHLLAFLNYMKQQGAEIDVLSLQNEPDELTTAESCEWTGEELRDFINQYGAELKATGVRLIASESTKYNRALTDPILNDSKASGQLDIVGTHLYYNAYLSIAPYALAESLGKNVWMTEHLRNTAWNDTELASQEALFTEDLAIANKIMQCMKANMSTYLWWYLRRHYGLIGDGNGGTTDGKVTTRGHILSHFARAATGRTRTAVKLPSKISSDVTATAYVGSDNSVGVVILNPTESAFNNLGVWIEGMTSTTAVSYTTIIDPSKTEGMKISRINAANGLDIPANSIVTIKFYKY